MAATTYDVRIWKTEVYRGKKVTTYKVRWSVAGRAFKEPYRNSAQAESFRSELVAAARRGEAFYLATGLPVSMNRVDGSVPWYTFALDYTDTKWPRIAATTRRTQAEALTAVTMLMLTSQRGKPDDALLRAALKRWAFNTARRDDPARPENVSSALEWVASHSKPVAALTDSEDLRRVLDGLAVRVDGTVRAPSVVSRWRKILNNAVVHAIDRKILAVNPIPGLKWRPPRGVQVIDRRVVANPVQARSLIRAVGEDSEAGARLVAYFACIYFAALRPEEVAALHRHNVTLPSEGWGEFHLERAAPHAGKEWTNNGAARDDRQLKQREIGEVRPVPCPPELTAILHRHLAAYGTSPSGRIFVGVRTAEHLSNVTVSRVWQRARTALFTPEVAASPLAEGPYDLRHAAVSTWLNAGVPATKVAEWAGHSVEVLLKIYAKCIDGEDARLRARVQDALGHPPDSAENLGAS